MKTFIVYTALNKRNGKRYIGATSCGLFKRRMRHFQDAKSSRPGCRVFNAAIRKYGEDAFEWQVLESCLTHQEMMDAEIRLIADLRPEYNITSGGKGIIGVPRTAEWLAKTSKALKGRRPSQKCYDALRHEHFFKSVVCLNDGAFFKSVKAAAAHYGVGKRGISEMLHGRQNKVGGFSFALTAQPLPESQRLLLLAGVQEREAVARRSKGNRRKPVVCVTDGKCYESGAAAARAYNLAQIDISWVCRFGGATKSGISFSFVNAA